MKLENLHVGMCVITKVGAETVFCKIVELVEVPHYVQAGSVILRNRFKTKVRLVKDPSGEPIRKLRHPSALEPYVVGKPIEAYEPEKKEKKVSKVKLSKNPLIAALQKMPKVQLLELISQLKPEQAQQLLEILRAN